MAKTKAIAIKVKDCLSNLLSQRRFNLSYIVETVDWSVKWDGKQLANSLNKQKLLAARVSTSIWGIKNQIVHFGSVNTFLTQSSWRKPHNSNKLVLTWFHVVQGYKRNENILKAQNNARFIHTSCEITKKDLIALGVKQEKIVVIPLGVDLGLFKPITPEEKKEFRKKLGIPEGKIVIGSFQKDGQGWGDGMEPKMVKGPDIFIKAVEWLSRAHPVFVLLLGPARGYVKSQLKEKGIPFKDIGFCSFPETAPYYQALDLYIVSSRVEGGPKAILESMAAGVPLVSTKVGMAPDIAERNPQALVLAEVDDWQGLAQQAAKVIENNQLRQRLIENGFLAARNYSWDNIAKQYYEKIYQHLI